MIIDSHVHLFPEKLMKAVYAYFRNQYGWKINFPADPVQLLTILKEAGSSKCITLAYTHKPGLSRSLNQWLFDFCREHKGLVPFGAVHPAEKELPLIVEECLERFDFPGFKVHCLVQRCRPDDQRLYPLYEAVVEKSRAVIMHAGSFPQPYEGILEIGHVENLLRRYPTLKLIIAHLGLNDLSAYTGLMATYKNLYLDTAFVFQNEMIKIPQENIFEAINGFPDRIFYGSDFPFILEPPQNGIDRIKKLGLSKNVLDKLFYQNAVNFLAEINHK